MTELTVGDPVAMRFPRDHENHRMNGMTGKVTHRRGALYTVWMDTLWGALVLRADHLESIS